MELRQCGDSDLKLSVLGAGCWAFGGGKYWGDQSQKDADAVVQRSVELGINYFDTAEVYNDGASESSLGVALKGVRREDVVVGSKISPSNCEPATLIEHCEASLKRLGTDYIDIYMVHWPIHPHSVGHFTDDQGVIADVPSTEAAFETLGKLQEQGKIRHAGVSNFGADWLERAQATGVTIAVNELPYCLLTRGIETEALPYCRTHGVGVIGYMVLMQGVLADLYPTLADVPEWQRRTRHFSCTRSELTRHGGPGAEDETNQALADIRAIAKECGMTMVEVAVKWAVANKAVTCALVGARNRTELEANVRAVSEPLAPEIVEKLNAVTAPVMEALGPGFDYYESVENDRTHIPDGM